MGCSKLQLDLCFKLHILEEASCNCGYEYEDRCHYFMECANYTELRLELLNAIAHFFDDIFKYWNHHVWNPKVKHKQICYSY